MRYITLYFLLLISSNVMAGVDISGEIKKVIISGENPFFINIGESTKSILTQRAKSINNCSIDLKSGDAQEPIGNGEAEMYAVIICEGYTTIGLRLKRANIDHYL